MSGIDFNTVRSPCVAITIGVVLSTCLFSLAYALHNAVLIEAFILSGTPTAEFLLWILPDAFIYWLFPEGGGPAAIMVFTFSAWLQFMIVFSVCAHRYLRRNRKQPT